LKIAQKCKKKFVQLQPQESSPFIDEILMTLSSILSELTPSQVKKKKRNKQKNININKNKQKKQT